MLTRWLLISLTLALLVLSAVVASAQGNNLFYYSPLDGRESIISPPVGPPGEMENNGPVFREGPAGRGISARGGPASATGGFILPTEGWPTESGCLCFWLGLPEDFTLPQRAMPVLMSGDALQIQLDLREGLERLHSPAGPTAIAYWRAGERYHVALSWDQAANRLVLYLNGVQMAEADYSPVAPGEVLHVNSGGRAQANYATILSELRIETVARHEFPEVPAELREKIAARLRPQAFQPDTDTSLFGTTWSAEGDAAEIFNDLGGGVLGVRIPGGMTEPLVLRPAQDIPLDPDTLRIYCSVALGDIHQARFRWLVRFDDGQEGEVDCRYLRGRLWQELVTGPALSANYSGVGEASVELGGERRELVSLRPGREHPRGDHLPQAVTGMKIYTSDGGLIYLRDARPDKTEYLVHPKWQFRYLQMPTTLRRGYFTFGSEQPEIPIEWLVSKPGKYRVEYLVRTAYQGPVLAAGYWQGDWDDQYLDHAYRARMTLPLRKGGTYWVEFKVWDAQGDLVAEAEADLGIFRAEETQQPLPGQGFARLDSKLKLGFLEVDTGQENHVFSPASEAPLRFRVTDPGVGGPYTIHLTIERHSLYEPATVVETDLTCPPEGDLTYNFAVPASATDAAYDLTAELRSGERVLDRTQLLFGVKAEPEEAPPPLPGPTAQDLAGPGDNLISLGDAVGWYQPEWGSFDEVYGHAVAEYKRLGFNLVRTSLKSAGMMPLPGLVTFDGLDTRVRLLREADLPYMFAPDRSRHQPRWLPAEPMEDYQGLSLYASPAHGWQKYFLSMASSGFHQTLAQVLTACYRRYSADPLFSGWAYETDITWVDHGNSETDYSPGMQEAWLRYLQEDLGLRMIETLNQRWGTNLKNWSQVHLPLPTPEQLARYSRNASLNDDLVWQDYWNFKNDMQLGEYMGVLVGTLRNLGDARPVIFYDTYYAINVDNWLRDMFPDYGFHTMGVEGVRFLEEPLTAYAAGGAFLSEYQNLIPQKQGDHNVDMILAAVLWTGGSRTCHFNTFYNASNPDAMHAAGGRRLERQLAWLNSLKADFFPAASPAWELGCFWGTTNVSVPGCGNLLKTFWEHAQIPSHIVKSYFPQEFWNQRSVIVCGDYALDDESREKMLEYVRQGGKLVLLSPQVGRWTIPKTEEDHILLRELGWTDLAALKTEDARKVIAHSSGGLLGQTQPVQLLGQVPEPVSLPPGATVEATFGNGTPAIVRWSVGQGEAMLFLRTVDAASVQEPHAALLDDLAAWAGQPRYIWTEPLVYANYFEKGPTKYVFLYRSLGSDGKRLIKDSVEPATQPVTFRTPQIPEGTYQLTSLGPEGEDLGTRTAQQLRQGVEVQLPGMRVLLIKLMPQ